MFVRVIQIMSWFTIDLKVIHDERIIIMVLTVNVILKFNFSLLQFFIINTATKRLN